MSTSKLAPDWLHRSVHCTTIQKPGQHVDPTLDLTINHKFPPQEKRERRREEEEGGERRERRREEEDGGEREKRDRRREDDRKSRLARFMKLL